MLEVLVLAEEELVVGEIDGVVLAPEQRRAPPDHVDVLLVLLDLEPRDGFLDPSPDRPEPERQVELDLQHAPRRVPLGEHSVHDPPPRHHDMVYARTPS